MNINEPNIDRLVDDELDEPERRKLLTQLDEEPGGWRRCALAFLEAQCWRQSLESAGVSPAVGTADTGTGGTPSLRNVNPRRSPWTGRVGLLSAMAASFLMALWIGTAARREWQEQPGGTGGPVQVADNKKPVAPAIGSPPVQLAGAPRVESASPNPWQLVAVSVPSEGERPRLMNIPAIERDRVDEQWLRNAPAIPDHVLQALARTGHQIQQKQELVPVSLGDGRNMVVPVNHVDVHCVGNQSF
jgi:hypothetical protein